MRLLWLYLLSFLTFPIIGEFIVWYKGLTIEAGNVNLSLIINNVIFIAILVIIAYIIQKYRFKKKIVAPKFDYFFTKKIINRSVLVLILATFIVFALVGWKILFHIANRGEIRVSLGMFGPFYAWILLYLTPAILILNSIIYLRVDDDIKKRLKNELFLLYFLAILIGILTGYKATFVLITIGGIVVLTYDSLSLKRLLLLCSVIMIGLIFTTILVQGVNVLSAVNFLIYRATVMTSYGTIATWNIYPYGAPFDERLFNFLSIFGNKMASLISGYPINSVEFLKINLARLITYMRYPDISGAIRGTVNVTVTNFGEAVYFFGRQLYFIYAVMAGLIVGVIIRKFRKSIMYRLPFKGTLLGVYLFSVIIPWINSASIWNLIGLPTIIWLFGIYIVLYLIIKIKPIYPFETRKLLK
jgi:hypothetical protein